METRVERIAWNDGKIDHGDISRLEQNNSADLEILRKVMPKVFFDQLSQWKWFWTGKNSFLEKNGYIEKINSIEWNYRWNQTRIRQETRESLQETRPSQKPSENKEEGKEFYRTLSLSSPYMRGNDVKILQEKLQEFGFNSGRIDGVFWKNTMQALMQYQRSIWEHQTGILELWSKTMKKIISGRARMSTKSPSRESLTPKPREVSERLENSLKQVWITSPEVQRNIQGALVSINIWIWWGGTGTFIDSNIILTAEHVVKNIETWKIVNISNIKWADGKVYHVEKIYIDPSNNDIAYIQTKEIGTAFLSYAPDSSRVKTEGILLWYSGGKPRFYSSRSTEETRITEEIYNQQDRERFWNTTFVNFPARKGDSGGPIIDNNGNVLWIIVRSYEYGNNGVSGGIGEPIEDIRGSSASLIS